MTVELTLARVGMNMEEATIVKWRRQPGESFATGETLYEIETDKVTFEVEAPFAGTLREIRVQEGETATVGQVVGLAEPA
jgi:pyruvate/2-oxoglutarate dehydrogenase complex dihydrolipoamide acyltransferase (E2) component